MLSTLRELSEDPGLHGRYLYTGLHCERCQKDREKRWGQEWDRQEREYQERLLELRALPYEEYLRSAHWRRRRTEKLEGAGRRCELCGASRAPLDVHHRTYERMGEEQDGDLNRAVSWLPRDLPPAQVVESVADRTPDLRCLTTRNRARAAKRHCVGKRYHERGTSTLLRAPCIMVEPLCTTSHQLLAFSAQQEQKLKADC